MNFLLDQLDLLFPKSVPRLMLQCLAAPLGGATTTILTTPMDAIRARIQVSDLNFSRYSFNYSNIVNTTKWCVSFSEKFISTKDINIP